MLWTWFCKYVDLYLTWNSFQSMKLYWEDFFRIVASLSCSAPPHVKNGLLSEWSVIPSQSRHGSLQTSLEPVQLGFVPKNASLVGVHKVRIHATVSQS